MENMVDFTSLIFPLIFIGFLTEAVTEIVKQYFLNQNSKDKFLPFVSLVIALLLTFAMNVSIFESSQTFAYYLGVVVCALVASRGSSYVHNFFDKLPKRS